MVHPPRVSSLDDQAAATPVYRFVGNAQDGNLTTSSLPPQSIFDRDSKSPLCDDEHNEKSTGFRTPNSEDTDKPLAYSYQYAPGGNKVQHIPPQYHHLLRQHYGKKEWRNTHSMAFTEFDDDDICPPGYKEIIVSRAFKRWAILYILGVIAFWVWFFRYYRPEQKRAVASSFLTDSLKGRFLEDSEFGYFGTNKRVEFSGMQHMEILDRSLVPGSETPGVANRRLIVVGDIHGCADELRLLLDQVSYDPSKDHIITTGDMISKGPASSEVLDILMANNASCVRGNNEDRILHAYRDHHAPSHQKILSKPDSLPSAISLKHGHSTDLALAASLSPHQISYLSSCPLIINLGTISTMGNGNTSVVHAGLIPGLPLERQDPNTIMTIRSIDLRNQVPSPHHAPDPTIGPPPRPRSRRIKPDYTNYDDKGRLAVLPWGPVWDSFQDLIPTLLEEGLRREHNPPPPPPPPPQSTSRRGRRTNNNNSKPPKRGTTKLNPYKDLAQTSVIHGHSGSQRSEQQTEQRSEQQGLRKGVQQGVTEGKWHIGLGGGCFESSGGGSGSGSNGGGSGGGGGVLAALVLDESGFLSKLGRRRVKRSIVSVPCGGSGSGSGSENGSGSGSENGSENGSGGGSGRKRRIVVVDDDDDKGDIVVHGPAE